MARPVFKPTRKMRETAKIMAGLGVRTDDIAKVIGITPKTLRKHFRAELDLGMIEANAKVVKSLFQMATSGKNTSAAIFWAETRCGFNERAGAPDVENETKIPQIVLKVEGDLGE